MSLITSHSVAGCVAAWLAPGVLLSFSLFAPPFSLYVFSVLDNPACPLFIRPIMCFRQAK